MIQSEPILPIRFYNDLYSQDRFNKFHDRSLETHLSYPPNKLPSFQIKREHSTNIPTSFVLKRVCNEDADRYLTTPEKASNFATLEDSEAYYGDFPKVGPGLIVGPPPAGTINAPIVKYSNCKSIVAANDPLYSLTPPSGTDFQVPIYAGGKHKIKIIVERFSRQPASTFSIRIFDGVGGLTLGTITAPGVYIYDFVATNSVAMIQFDSIEDGDDFEISYFQVSITPVTASLYIGDAALDETEIQVFEKADGYDLLVWLGTTQNYQVEPGYDYYYIVESADEIYYSEVFTVRRIKDLEKYYCLEWYNDCDLSDKILYSLSSLIFRYSNKLYLDAALFKPEYDTETTAEPDSENNKTPILKRWQKYISLEIMKAPEFLADSLSAIFLHNVITLTEPLQNKQQVQNSFSVVEVTPNVEPVLNDEFQKVTLKLLLSDNFIKSNCCEDVVLD